MVLTIITCSKNLRSVYSSMLLSFVSFLQRDMEHTWRTFMKIRKRALYRYIDFRVSYIHLKDATIIQTIFLSVNPDKVTN